MDTDGGKGQDPNAAYDQQRARGEDPRLADIKSDKEHQAEPVPFKITNTGSGE